MEVSLWALGDRRGLQIATATLYIRIFLCLILIRVRTKGLNQNIYRYFFLCSLQMQSVVGWPQDLQVLCYLKFTDACTGGLAGSTKSIKEQNSSSAARRQFSFNCDWNTSAVTRCHTQVTEVHCTALPFRSAVQCSAVHFSSVQCSAVQCGSVQFRDVQDCAVEVSEMKCSADGCSAWLSPEVSAGWRSLV